MSEQNGSVFRIFGHRVPCWLLIPEVAGSTTNDDWFLLPSLSKYSESHGGNSSAIQMPAVKLTRNFTFLDFSVGKYERYRKLFWTPNYSKTWLSAVTWLSTRIADEWSTGEGEWNQSANYLRTVSAYYRGGKFFYSEHRALSAIGMLSSQLRRKCRKITWATIKWVTKR